MNGRERVHLRHHDSALSRWRRLISSPVPKICSSNPVSNIITEQYYANALPIVSSSRDYDELPGPPFPILPRWGFDSAELPEKCEKRYFHSYQHPTDIDSKQTAVYLSQLRRNMTTFIIKTDRMLVE